MASKTYLNMINHVYRNLREDEITSITNDYDRLIGQFVNQAKEIVEDAWQWHVFRKTITWNSQTDVSAYDLTDDVDGAGDAASGSNLWLAGRSYPYTDPYGRLIAYDTTTSGQYFRLERVPNWYGRDQQQNAASVDKPHQIFFDSSGVHFVRAPNSTSRSYSLLTIIPQDELSSADTTLTLPYWRPVVTLATAWAVNERGEELGNRPILPQSVMSIDWALQAENDLAEAIARDATLDATELDMNSEQIVWQGGRA